MNADCNSCSDEVCECALKSGHDGPHPLFEKTKSILLAMHPSAQVCYKKQCLCSLLMAASKQLEARQVVLELAR